MTEEEFRNLKVTFCVEHIQSFIERNGVDLETEISVFLGMYIHSLKNKAESITKEDAIKLINDSWDNFK